MAALSPPATVTAAGQQLVFHCPQDQLVNPANIVVFNKSPFELELMGSLIPARSIMPFPLAAQLGGATTVIMTSLLATGVTFTAPSSVYVQWFSETETVPAQQAFPIDNTYSIYNVGSVAVTGGSTTTQTIVVPTAPYLVITVTPSAVSPNGFLVTVTGNQSGVNYVTNDIASPYHFVCVPLSLLDTSVTVSLVPLTTTSSPGPTVNVYASATPLPEPPPLYGVAQLNITASSSVYLVAANFLQINATIGGGYVPLAILVDSLHMAFATTAAGTVSANLTVGTISPVRLHAEDFAVAGATQVSFPPRAFGGMLIANGQWGSGHGVTGPDSLALTCAGAGNTMDFQMNYRVLA